MSSKVVTTCPNCGEELQALTDFDAQTAPWLCADCARGWWDAELTAAARGAWDARARTCHDSSVRAAARAEARASKGGGKGKAK